jgi:predicted HTH domain antitoxin
MPAIISDEFLRAAGLTEQEARTELACRLYDAQRIGKGLAARLAGLTRLEFEDELVKRGLPVIRYTEQMWEQDLRTLGLLNAEGANGDAGRQ